ncbi:hypothetical protein ACFW1P_07745 [Paenibacillus sp. NPDC058910]|uniref:hypothetical protein n=1 Tax=unclassified Paenibacillus TaxID=185978 RepID=UPI0036CB807A
MKKQQKIKEWRFQGGQPCTAISVFDEGYLPPNPLMVWTAPPFYRKTVSLRLKK